MADVEIDQSGRTDVLTVDTVLALSNEVQVAILIPRRVKRACYAELRARGMRKALIGVRLFSAGLVLLLEEWVQNLGTITIDLEYAGWEGEIKRHLLRQLHARGHHVARDQVVFGQIGKKSRAHDVAWHTFRGNRTAERQLAVKELIEAC